MDARESAEAEERVADGNGGGNAAPAHHNGGQQQWKGGGGKGKEPGKGKGKGGGASFKGDSKPKKGKGKGSNKDIQCYTCGKWGHMAQSCWSIQQVQGRQETSQTPGLPASSSKGSPAPSIAAVMSVRICKLTRRTKPSTEIRDDVRHRRGNSCMPLVVWCTVHHVPVHRTGTQPSQRYRREDPRSWNQDRLLPAGKE